MTETLRHDKELRASSTQRPQPGWKRLWQSPYFTGLAVLILSIAVLGIVNQKVFFTPSNIETILTAYFIEMALGTIAMTLVILVRGIDLSIGGVIGLTAVGLGWLLNRGCPIWLTLVAALAIGGLCGLLNGVVVTRFRTPAVIATLGSGIMFYGIAVALSKGVSYSDLPNAFVWIGQGRLAGVPVQVFLFVLIAVLTHVILSYSRYGRWVYAVGGNIVAARFSGIKANRVLVAVYTISGLLGGVAAIIMSARYNSGKATNGQGMELYLITAALLGGVSIAGGEGTVAGALLGMSTMAVLWEGMNLASVHASVQAVVIAILVLVVLLVNRYLAQKRISV